MNRATLEVFDFDQTLYDSPKPPKGTGDVWWFHAYSLGEPGQPGYDFRWNLDVVTKARHAALDPQAVTAVLTGRSDHPEMRLVITKAIHRTGIKFDHIQLKPVLFGGTTPMYKAQAVERWLKKLPSVRVVRMYDDLTENLFAVEQVVDRRGVRFEGFLV